MNPLILVNNGNLCFVNAIMQALYSLQEFRDLFIGDLTACPLSSEIVSLFQSEGKTSVSVKTVLE